MLSEKLKHYQTLEMQFNSERYVYKSSLEDLNIKISNYETLIQNQQESKRDFEQ